MQAAIYARKSTDQHAIADEAKSVTRQIDHATHYAAKKGWTVSDAHIYVDDGISGAEFAKRPSFLRLMNTLKPRPPFDVLIMSEESRLGREQIETAYSLKQIITAGVRVFYYLDDRERTLDSPTDKIMQSLTAFADELEREKARQRVHDVMTRKAKAGHVTGGRCFGYDNVEVLDANGKRAHVERRINEAEADVVRQIFTLCAQGVGQVRIAKMLNADRAIAPRSQRGRPRAWAPSSVHEILFRDLYRGVITWNKTKKRNTWGEHKQSMRPADEWIAIPAPALQIVSDAAWDAAHRRIATSRVQYDRDTQGRRRRRRDVDSKYLLPSFGRCGMCGGGLHVRSRAHGKRRAFHYACTSHYNRGPSVCPHVELWPMGEIDRAVLGAIAGDVLAPDLVEEIVAEARAQFGASSGPDVRYRLRYDLAAVEQEQARLADAISAGADAPVLVERLKVTEQRRRELAASLEAEQTRRRPAWREIERRARRSLADWRALLTGDVVRARAAFRQLLTEPITFTPYHENGRRGLRFEGRVGLEAVLGGEVVTKLASPTGFEPVS